MNGETLPRNKASYSDGTNALAALPWWAAFGVTLVPARTRLSSISLTGLNVKQAEKTR